MRNLWKGSALAVLILFYSNAMAERPQIKFGEVKPKDFENKLYTIDSNANAVVIADIGSCKYEGDNLGGFSIVYKKHLRIHLLNRNGFDAANISIPLYVQAIVEEKVEKLEASTFNLDNGKVVETKLDKQSIFKDKLSKYYNIRKFTMPDLKEGSIIDIQYTITSPYEQYLHSWQFQGAYPVLWSEFSASVPTIFNFVSISQGYQPYTVKTAKMGTANYSVLVPGGTGRSEVVSVASETVNSIWAMENVPAIKTENFTSTLENHIARISFQLSKVQYPNSPARQVMNNWYEVGKTLMNDPDFGEEITKSVGWLADDNKKITAGAPANLEAAKKIFKFIRDNFTCTSHYARYKSASLRKIMQNKSGNVADMNILLTAMLWAQGFVANPVLLSTRDHGKAYEIYPVMDKFNYVVCHVIIDDVPYLLDASYSKLGFGQLNSDCYNGFARIISDNPQLINLEADSLQEVKITSMFILNNDKGGMDATYQSVLGQNESFNLREKINKTGKEAYFKDLKSGFSTEIVMKDMKIDSLNILEEPVQVSYGFNWEADEDIIYFNPLMSEAYKKNPFTAAQRVYPVEMQYSMNEIFTLRMDVPAGYKVDEVPKSTRVKYNDDEGMFEYLITVSGNIIQMRSKIQLKKATYQPEDYESLRDFFAYIVKKHSEQIVFKKIN